MEETFGPPVVRMETGGDVLTPVVSGAAASGYYFDGTSVSSLLFSLAVLLLIRATAVLGGAS